MATHKMKTKVLHNGVVFKKGAEIEEDHKDFSALKKQGLVEKVEQVEEPAEPSKPEKQSKK